LTPAQLEGFFAGWPNPPTAATLLRILQGSSHAIVAQLMEEQAGGGPVVGYITALTDGVSAAYLPHLEVRVDWQNQGIGRMLVEQMLAKLRNIYMIDLVCDPELGAYYERFGFQPYHAMVIRNYERQRCD
jgi:predicted N-acetyltransferase YhbS